MTTTKTEDGPTLALLGELMEEVRRMREETEAQRAALEEVRENTRRNTAVAEQYGAKAGSIFGFIDRVSLVLNNINPIKYISGSTEPAEPLLLLDDEMVY